MLNRIDLPLARSALAGLIAAFPWFTLALAALALGQLQHPLLWLLCPLAVAGGLRQYRDSGWLQPASSVSKLSVNSDRLYAHLNDGRQLPVSVSGDSRLYARLAILKLTPTDTSVKSALVILVDPGLGLTANVDPVAFRRLRVWLRLASLEAETGPDALSR